MEVDDSFKKPGAIPFKWEIRPGVPKLQHSQQQYYQSSSSSSSYGEEFSFPETPRKLAPPPTASAGAGYCFQTGSFRSAPPPRSGSSRSRSFRFYSSNNKNNNINNLAQQQHVGVSAASGCFPSPLLIKRRSEIKKKHKTSKKTTHHEDMDSATAGSSDLDTLSPLTGRLSVSSRSSSSWKSLSPLRDSPLSSSFSSYRYATPPRRLLRGVSNDAAEWASFGLF